jgi:hypothetical protein
MIKWPRGVSMQNMMLDFNDWCSLPLMQGAIDGMRIFIPKPNSPFAKDYYFRIIGWYFIVYQTVVDAKKHFTNLYVRLLSSMNEFRILHKSGVYLQVH